MTKKPLKISLESQTVETRPDLRLVASNLNQGERQVDRHTMRLKSQSLLVQTMRGFADDLDKQIEVLLKS